MRFTLSIRPLRMHAMNTHEAALFWAKKGVAVLPLHQYSKKPATTCGLKDATKDEQKINAWFKDTNYNLGLRTGIESGFNVLDIDIKGDKNGLKSLTSYFNDDFLLPDNSLLFKTPSGGLHIPVQIDDQIQCGNGVNVLGIDGVDIRGNDGYIVAAPSCTKTNDKVLAYRVNDYSLPFTKPYGWILRLFTQFIQSKQTYRFDPQLVMEGVTSGQRNARLFAYARHLFTRGFDKGLVLGFVSEAAHRCSPPLPQNETLQIIENAFVYQGHKPVKSNNKQSLKDLL